MVGSFWSKSKWVANCGKLHMFKKYQLSLTTPHPLHQHQYDNSSCKASCSCSHCGNCNISKQHSLADKCLHSNMVLHAASSRDPTWSHQEPCCPSPTHQPCTPMIHTTKGNSSSKIFCNPHCGKLRSIQNSNTQLQSVRIIFSCIIEVTTLDSTELRILEQCLTSGACPCLCLFSPSRRLGKSSLRSSKHSPCVAVTSNGWRNMHQECRAFPAFQVCKCWEWIPVPR